MVAWASPSVSTRSPLIHVLVLTRCSMMATRAGCASALATAAVAFCFSVNRPVFDVPMCFFLIVILRYIF